METSPLGNISGHMFIEIPNLEFFVYILRVNEFTNILYIRLLGRILIKLFPKEEC